MYKFNELLEKWSALLTKIEINNGEIHPIDFGETATSDEILNKEKELGYQLPPSYKVVVQNFAKSLSFYYSFSADTMIPREFSEIYSGAIEWDFEMLENLDDLADDLMEDGIDYGKNLRNKVQFAHSGNGDIYAFDMATVGEEKPVIYWTHEEDTVIYIADTFLDYLEKITELNCIGNEIWQFAYFLNENGLDSASSKAKRWKEWFVSFSETAIADVKDDLDQLIAFTVYRKKLDDKARNAFHSFQVEQLFERLLAELDTLTEFIEQKMICEIIGETVGAYAKEWVKELWKDSDRIDSRLRSYLTAKCLDETQGLNLVISYLEETNQKKISGYDALTHLYGFRSEQLLSWMESNVNFPTDSWDQLFLHTCTSWKDFVKWANLEERHQVTIIHALEHFVSHRVDDLLIKFPPKEEFRLFLQELKEKQLLKKRKAAIDYVLEHLELLYKR